MYHIHGTESNPFVELAKSSATQTVACGAVYSTFDSRGRRTDREAAKQAYEQVWDLLTQASEFSRMNYEHMLSAATLKECFNDRTAGNEAADLLDAVVEMWEAFMGAE
ncbi:hypothetical protein K461DRAFT_324360 [Myriangium duriaei CBS 260.36]|uniref:Uncharacterized protein n=1 Tax=Myriangium duriaei CBS 260.36 TaxID=1168546 RepID=A0A9P4ISK1_9PEZI|nr:hypothetical protein K461DRAFT_324360 [Myriangium duriaei CBS 260.36]